MKAISIEPNWKLGVLILRAAREGGTVPKENPAKERGRVSGILR